MKKIKTSLLILILVLTSTILFPIISNATINPENYKPDSIVKSEMDGIDSIGEKIAGAIQIVGTMVSVGTMIIIGIRYVVASADEKAEYKERMIPYFIGAVLLFGASNIVNIIYQIF